MNRLLVLSMLILALTACSSQQRTEPPAPVVSVSAPPAPVAPPPKPEPVAPKVQPVQVYAYQHPGEVPPVPAATGEQQPAAPDGAAATESPAVGSGDQAAPAPQQPESPKPAESPQQSAPSQVAAASPPPPPTGDSALAKLSPPTQALALQAEQQRQMGDYPGAAATLERGLRISPQEAYLWNRLARVRLEQGLHSQAGNLAARSNSLAGNQPTLKQDNWRIIADAKRRAGDVTGAQEAELKARGG